MLQNGARFNAGLGKVLPIWDAVGSALILRTPGCN